MGFGSNNVCRILYLNMHAPGPAVRVGIHVAGRDVDISENCRIHLVGNPYGNQMHIWKPDAWLGSYDMSTFHSYILISKIPGLHLPGGHFPVVGGIGHDRLLCGIVAPAT